MSTHRTTAHLARGATAALLLSTACTLVVTGPASAAPGDPADSLTVAVTPTTPAGPGRAQPGSVTVLAADGTPVDAGQQVTVSVDHGFFTDGPVLPTTAGAPAGDLHDLGTTRTLTTDANGVADFAIGIARDGGFDDDGRVTALVSARSGAASGQRSATWSSADPLNGGSVEVVLSPAEQQEAPVAPAVSGDRTYYDVVTRDQFGNPVAGASVDLGFDRPGDPDDFDYSDRSVESDLVRDGDFWVTSFEAAGVPVTGTWTAPTTTYAGTTGTTVAGTRDVEGTVTASFYDVSFAGSSYALTPSAGGEQPVGTTLTQTVSVTDQLGRPVRSLEVQFFRFGPSGETPGEKQVDRITNARGQASYSFVGTEPGVAKVTAVVTDGISQRTLVSEVGFKHVTTVSVGAVKARSKGKKVKGKGAASDPTADVLRIRGQKVAAGAAVDVFRVKGSKLKAVGPQKLELDKSGAAVATVRDKNGKRATRYVVVVRATSTAFGATSAPTKVR